MSIKFAVISLAALIYASPSLAQNMGSRENPITDASKLPLTPGVYMYPGSSCAPEITMHDDQYFDFDGRSFNSYESSCEIDYFFSAGATYWIRVSCRGEGETWIDDFKFNISSPTSLTDEMFGEESRRNLCPGSVPRGR